MWDALRTNKCWSKQDLAFAKALKDYGFTSVLRLSESRIVASFDEGPYVYELPAPVCFLFMEIMQPYSIDLLIKICEGRTL